MFQSNDENSQISAINRKKELQVLLSEFKDEINSINIDDSVLQPNQGQNHFFQARPSRPKRPKVYKSLFEELDDLINEVSYLEKKVKALGFSRFTKEMTKLQQVKEYLTLLKKRAASL